MKPTLDRFFAYTDAILKGEDLTEFSDVVEWLRERILCYTRYTNK